MRGEEAVRRRPGAPDVFPAVLAEHPEERAKIRIAEDGIEDALREDEPSQGERLVALLDASGHEEAVGAGLTTLFRKHRGTVGFLVGCRGDHAPSVQAGIADFLRSSQGAHRFRAVADLGPALAVSGPGIVYAEASAAEAEATFERIAREFSRKLDPLRLLGREEELIAAVTGLNRRLSEADEHVAFLKKQEFRLQERVSDLEAQVAKLRVRQSSRRYRLADILVEKALRMPVLKRLARRSAPPLKMGIRSQARRRRCFEVRPSCHELDLAGE